MGTVDGFYCDTEYNYLLLGIITSCPLSFSHFQSAVRCTSHWKVYESQIPGTATETVIPVGRFRGEDLHYNGMFYEAQGVDQSWNTRGTCVSF